MYQNIEIKNFRGISSLLLDDLKQINLIVGKNNTGKTSLLEALFLISGISNPQLPFTVNTHRGLNYLTDKEEPFLIYHNLKLDSPVHIKAQKEKQTRELSIQPHFAQNSGETITTIEKEFLGKNLFNTLLNIPTDGYKYEIKITNENEKPKTFIAEIYPQGLLFQQKIPNGYKETVNCTYVNPLNILQQLPAGLNELIVNKKIDKIVQILKQIDNKIQTLYLLLN